MSEYAKQYICDLDFRFLTTRTEIQNGYSTWFTINGEYL